MYGLRPHVKRYSPVLASAMILIVVVLCPIAVHADSRPNIVLIMADDLGYEAVGCYGGTSYKTPNLDQLARQGMRFDRAYAMPLCTNTRVQLMTAKYNLRNWKAFGILDPKEITFGHLMQKAGYRTCIAGKWQLTSYDPPDYPGARSRRNTGMHPRDAGFDEYSLWHVGHTEDKGSRYADPVIEQNGQMLHGTAGRYGPDIWTDYICDFMERHVEEPFFVYYSMALPHNPMVPTPDSPEWRDPSRRHIDETRFAADMIRYTDKMVGKLVARIDDLNLREKTLILFYSDNGTNWRVASRLGERLVRGGKGEPTELGIRVPTIASWKGVTPAGTVTDALVDSVDFLPTILQAAGADSLIPIPIDGTSFLPVIQGRSKGERQWIYIHQDPRPGWDKDPRSLIRLAINQRFKLYEDGRLFDLNEDPFEEHPLFVASDDSLAHEHRKRLQSVLDSMKPYPMFDPDTVPRPNPADFFDRYQFHDQGGYVVIEAECVPVPRDESWRSERTLPGYTGFGYLRSLRDQDGPPMKGRALVKSNIHVAGKWNVAVRCRTDHPSGNAENRFWIKIGDSHWMTGQVSGQGNASKWIWVKTYKTTSGLASQAQFQLSEKGNHLWFAPQTGNLKIDRIVLYQSDKKLRALDATTPMSKFHPWASP